MSSHPRLLWPDEAAASGARPATSGTTPHRHWRIRALWRMRPLPITLWLAIGLGPLAWAWHSAALAPMALSAAGATAWKLPSAAPEGMPPAPALAEAPAPQWGDPLPRYRQEFELREAIAQGLVQAPDTSRRRSGAVVLASDFYRAHPQAAPQAESTAESQAEMVLAQAAVRSGMRLRLDASWRGTREIIEAINPLVKAPRAPVAPVGAAANSGPGRALRIAELPDIVGLPHTLPVDEQLSMPPSGVDALTLQKAIDKGLARSAEVQAAHARLDAYRHAQRATLGNLLPQADLRAAAGTGRGEGAGGSSERQRRDGQFTVRQTLLDLPASRDLDRDKALSVAAELQWQASVSDVSVEIANAYIQLLNSRIALTLGQRHERQLNRLLAQLNERAAGNANATLERNRLQARVAQARSQGTETLTTLRAATAHLASLTGENPQVLALGLPASLNIPRDAATARDDASRLNRELLAARTEAVATAYEALSHRARMMPKLQAELSHSRQTNIGGMPGDSRDTRGMLVLNWQLYNGGSDQARQRAAQSREKERELRADELKRRIDHDLNVAYGSLDTVGQRFASLREELLAHASVISGLEQQALAGQRPMLDVLDAYQRLHNTRLELTALVLGEVHSTLRVAQHTGRLGAYSAQPLR